MHNTPELEVPVPWCCDVTARLTLLKFSPYHHLANQETDEILRNRLAIMSNMIAEQDVEINFRESMNNKAQLDFLEHKSSVNKTILEVNKQLSTLTVLDPTSMASILDLSRWLKSFDFSLVIFVF